MARRFSMSEAISFGWDTMKANIGFFIGLLIVAFLIENIPGTLGRYARGDFPLIGALLTLAGVILGFVVQMGLIRVSLKFCDGERGKLDDLLSSFDLLLNFIAGGILYALIVMAGFILLIVPGVIWAVKFSLFPYFIVDNRLGPIEALKASGIATTDAKFDLFLFGLLLSLINLAGFLCLVVGLFATIPTSLVAYAYVFRHLSPEPSRMPGATAPAVSKSAKSMYIKLD
jgi:uncharacterized membrane protein